MQVWNANCLSRRISVGLTCNQRSIFRCNATVPDYEDLIESDDEQDYDDDDDIQYGNRGGSLPLHRANDDDEHFHANKHLTVSNDDRPITPMRDKMVYNIGESSLDFKDGQ